ncbi:DUF4156 domain-containing protein [Pseudomarimonas arenosa]|uniref:DUF4156 domain-containing protein n=1 Tax=Pseudomarimonas arenosa TaxID=2774145 RepID=A0AAW3ZMI6_9GAMM|nr:DUF4156 domain-containing protein [Pseudomarimonas arenosa]MBD8526744.1 DUF4156 domain-containing protein [Pseudomarimonas arenosa]
MSVSRHLVHALGLASLASLSACTWVKMENQAYEVRVAGADESLSQCKRLGEIAVEVKDKVGFYRRDPIKVQDELEVMARNEAPRMQADTLQAVAPPLNGEQRWIAFNCRGGVGQGVTAADSAAETRASGEAETFPVR